jgi:hypothetical protein
VSYVEHPPSSDPAHRGRRETVGDTADEIGEAARAAAWERAEHELKDSNGHLIEPMIRRRIFQYTGYTILSKNSCLRVCMAVCMVKIKDL